jgi:myosin heavy subunit
MKRDAELIKRGIIGFIQRNGPSLPIQISKSIQMDGIFASAFLSELVYEKLLRMSHMRVGSSPVYFIPEQEPLMERYGESYLKSKERDAFFLLKENKFLKDSEQEPAIRVALRAIKDFALPIQQGNEIVWKYFKTLENIPQQIIVEPQTPKLIQQEVISPVIINTNPPEQKEVIIERVIEKSKEPQKETIPPKEIITKKEKPKKLSQKKYASSKKQDNKFLEKVKEFLAEKNAEILEIISTGKSDLILKVRLNNKEKMLIAYNKKSISEKEIIQAHKKSLEYNLPFLVMSLGDMPKKLNDLIEALKSLAEIEKIE